MIYAVAVELSTNSEPDRGVVIAIATGVIIVGLVMAIWLFAPSDGASGSVTVDNRSAGNGPVCVEQREEPQYAKWVRERETTESEWGEWYLYDGGSVTSWVPGTGFLGSLMQYEYRPNGVTRTVDVPVDCPTTTVAETTTTLEDTTSSSSSSTTTEVSPPSSEAPASSTSEPGSTTTAVATSSSPSSTLPSTNSTPQSSEPSSTPDCPQGTHRSGQGCLPDEAPPAKILVCRDGAVVEIDVADRRRTDSDNLERCGLGLPATK